MPPAVKTQRLLMRSLQIFFWLLALTVFSSSAIAQSTGTIRGFVYDKDNGQPVLFTNVYLEGTTFGASTDENGFFAIAKIPPGDYDLKVKDLNYEEYTESIAITAGKIQSKKIYLNSRAVDIDEVEISAERSRNLTQVKMSVTKISPKEIKSLPSIGGQPDLAQYLQVVPGVIFTGDQGGQLYIRGGSPIQNKVLLDGMVVYNPFHSIGLFSVFDTDIISNTDVYTGGFNARYGGRISSVMDIKTKSGNKTKHSGKVGVNPFGAKVMVEGPMKKLDPETGVSSSYILSAKTSYLEQTSSQFYGYAADGELPFTFTDLYGKLSFNSPTGSQFNLFGFNFTDAVRYQDVSDLRWDSYGFGSNFMLVPSSSPTIIEGNFAYSAYDISLTESDQASRRSTIDNFNFGLNFKYFNGDNETRYGFNIRGISTLFDYFNRFGADYFVEDNATELAGYVVKKIATGVWVFEPSLRAHYYASLSQVSLEPRLGLKYNATERIRFKAAAGRYSQNLIAGNSDRDIVNLFYGFISSPNNLPRNFTTQDGDVVEIDSKLQTANHLIVGTEIDVTDKLSLNLEGYVKEFDQLSNINRQKIFEDNAQNANRPEELRKDFIVETGLAQGLDFTAKYTTSRFYLWMVYSLAKVTRWDGNQTYAPVFDRRHNVNLVGSYTFGEDRAWEVNARWNLGSPLPFTQTQGFYEQTNFDNGYNNNFTNENGEFAILYSDLNGGRLSYYHRLDLSVKRTWKFQNDRSLEAVASVTNAYNRNNIFYVDAVRGNRVFQLPILPSLGFTYAF